MLLDSVDPEHAPVPRNDSERLLFSHISETLVRLDCRGQLRGGLASGWSRDEIRREWTFTLGDGQQSGWVVEAADIVSSWKARAAVLQALGIESAAVDDKGRVVVALRGVPDSHPLLFADPALAVVHTPLDSLRRADRFTLRGSPAGPVLDFRVEPDRDPRDALDQGADLLITRDPELVEYASTRTELTTFPLPWSRTYVLLQSLSNNSHRAVAPTDSAKVSLARDAVQAEARPAEPPFWWDTAECATLRREPPAPTTLSLIVYPDKDRVARGLAERLVALSGSNARLRAAGLADSAFDAALRAGTEQAYLVPAPRHSLAPCRDFSIWRAGVPVTPLIDTRARAIVRRGTPPLLIQWDGTVRVVP